MACLKMPEVNHVIIAGNLTKDPVIRKTSNGVSVINFCLASNHKYRDASNQWAEDVCYVGVVAWNKLAESCMSKLRKGSAALVDGELQSRTWHAEDGTTRTVVEIKAHRIQFLNKPEYPEYNPELPEFEEYDFTESQFAAGFDEASARETILMDRTETPLSLDLKLKPKNGV
ncbi:MAG TPA: single-stranded DNA-binding protein [Candidatus Kapabacteria bacterium]|jgi:single-strand DNA-binding protein|nr:single-stranded DNA-binding protein [Candidatus Kapabacteria bacterium]